MPWRHTKYVLAWNELIKRAVMSTAEVRSENRWRRKESKQSLAYWKARKIHPFTSRLSCLFQIPEISQCRIPYSHAVHECGKCTTIFTLSAWLRLQLLFYIADWCSWARTLNTVCAVHYSACMCTRCFSDLAQDLYISHVSTQAEYLLWPNATCHAHALQPNEWK